MAKKILVVEDDEILASSVEARLVAVGYNVTIATNGEEGLELVNKKKFDLVLLDVMLPKINGYDVCAAIKTNDKTKDIPIIMITALGTMADIDAAYKFGANDYVIKPFEFQRLISKIEALTGKDNN